LIAKLTFLRFEPDLTNRVYDDRRVQDEDRVGAGLQRRPIPAEHSKSIHVEMTSRRFVPDTATSIRLINCVQLEPAKLTKKLVVNLIQTRVRPRG
jgi:hypothetical protein